VHVAAKIQDKVSGDLMKQSKFVKDFKKNRELLFLSLPTAIFILIFSYIPMYGLLLPFKNYNYGDGFWKSKWAGLDNFKYLFDNAAILKITTNTILYNLAGIFLGLFFSIVFALMLNELSRRSVKFYQTTMFFPYFISWVVASYIVLGLLDMEHGFLNKILGLFGVQPIMWYNEPKYWPVILILTTLWKSVGYSTLIYYAGMIGISDEYYEAAELEGATRLQQARLITLPLLKPLITMLTILAIGRIFYGDFGLFYNIPRDVAALYPATDVIDTYVYRSLKKLGDIGMSSAAGFYQSTVGFILVLITNYIVKKFDKENAIF